MDHEAREDACGRALRLIVHALTLHRRVEETRTAARIRRAVVREAVALSRNERQLSVLRRALRARRGTLTAAMMDGS